LAIPLENDNLSFCSSPAIRIRYFAHNALFLIREWAMSCEIINVEETLIK